MPGAVRCGRNDTGSASRACTPPATSSPMGSTMTSAGTVHDALSGRAFLHDDPAAYLAGVDDAVAEAVERDGDARRTAADEPSGPAER